MMQLQGRSIIEGEPVADDGSRTFRAFNPSEGREFGPEFYEATPAVVARALAAGGRGRSSRALSTQRRAPFLSTGKSPRPRSQTFSKPSRVESKDSATS